MAYIGKFAEKANNPTMRSTVDPNGSTVDKIFADAVMASIPTMVMEQYGLALVKDIPEQHDTVSFPIYTNFDLTWNNLSESGSANNGSVITMTAGNAVTYKETTPVLYSAGIFIADMVDISTNKSDFDHYSEIAGVQVARKKDTEFITVIAAEDQLTNVSRYAAGGFTANGSLSTGSTLTPSDLTSVKTLLSTGSDIYVPDVALMHRNQYQSLVLHQDFSVNANTAVSRKATWKDGELVRYDGLDIVVTELVTAGSGLEWEGVSGHPIFVFRKGKSVGFAEKKAAFKVNTVDDRIRHGKFKIFDVMLSSKVLIPASIVILRAAD